MLQSAVTVFVALLSPLAQGQSAPEPTPSAEAAAAPEAPPPGFPAKLIDLIEDGQVEQLAEHVRYPLVRPFPLDRVWEKADFVARHDEIFDAAYRQKIAASEPGVWRDAGYRGRHFEGLVVGADEDVILAINRESPAEKARRSALIEEVRGILHPSLQDFAEPVLYFETPKFKIWVDRVEDGAYRYASWARHKALFEEPDLSLRGSESSHGSMSLTNYDFSNGDYSYTVDPRSMKSGRPAIIVRKGRSEVLRQEGRWVSMAAIVADPGPGPAGFTPTGSELLTSYVPLPSLDSRSLGVFLRRHQLTLLGETHRVGPDPLQANGAEPDVSEAHTYIIGSCSAFEAFWVFAAVTGGDWFPRPDAPGTTWRDDWEDKSVERIIANDPSNRNEYMGTSLYVHRKKGTGEVVYYGTISDGEGGVSERKIEKKDGYTWVLTTFDIAD